MIYCKFRRNDSWLYNFSAAQNGHCSFDFFSYLINGHQVSKLLLSLNLWSSVEILQKDSQEEVKQDQMQAYVQKREEQQRWDTFDTIMTVHQCLPVFSDEDDEYWCKCHIKGVKVWSWRYQKLIWVSVTIRYETILIKPNSLTVKLHAKKREYKHAN